jgi:hypothetical protein
VIEDNFVDKVAKSSVMFAAHLIPCAPVVGVVFCGFTNDLMLAHRQPGGCQPFESPG